MKILIFIALVCGLASAVFVPPRHKYKKQVHLLGEKQCTYGPTYWCQNLTNAADCHATKHCIQTVWVHQELPPDTTSICDTCKEMVKEARDQLESNETMELIKEVFEGSCELLRLKPIVEECDKIADNYIPDLIETLASEMNPAAVCSVAGLCNNPKVHQLLAEAGENVQRLTASENFRNKCDECNTVMDIVVKKFNDLTQIEFMNDLLEFCGQLSSYSDACSNMVIRYFPDIYDFLKTKLNSNDVCLLSGECYTNFHKHEVEITPMSKIGYVLPEKKDDLPCELCEQLVTHLRDVLIANTTEIEFKQVLEGICKQTRSFKDQCLSFVNEYYSVFYKYLVTNLNATAACDLIGICPNGQQFQHPIAPLLLEDTAHIAKKNHIESPLVNHETKDIKKIDPNNMQNIGSPQQMQLPIDLLTPHHSVYSEQLCMFCQYFLHYCQVAISSPSVEADIKKVIDEACEKLPRSVNATCIEFIDTYEPALIAILAQEIDPSQVCPMIRVCPSKKAKDVEVFMNAKSSDNCPFCLAIVTEIEDLVKGKTSKMEIKQTLEKVCYSLPESLKVKCDDFIETYTDELVEMIIADFKPSEVCEYLKFCKDTTPPAKSIREEEITNTNYGGDIETNAIYDNTIDGKPIEHLGDMGCILCEYVMKEIDDQLKDKKTDDEIKKVVLGVCKIMPKSVSKECNNFINQYADAIIILLQEALEPSQICAMIKLCPKSDQLKIIRDEVTKCSVCISTVDIIGSIMENPNVDRNIGHIFEKTCRGIPSSNKPTEPERTLQRTHCYTLERQIDGNCLNMNDFHFNQFRLSVTRFVRENICSHLRSREFNNGKGVQNYLNHEDPLECFLCKTIVKEVAKQIKGEKTKEKVRHILQKVCKHIHIKNCSRFVNKYSDKLVDLIVQYASSSEVCSKLMVCESDVLSYNTKLLQSTLQYTKVFYGNDDIDDPAKCTLCKTVVKSVIIEIKNNTTKKNILYALHKVCKHIPCSYFVRTHSNKLVNLIMEYANPQVICTKLTVCNFDLLNDKKTYIQSSGQQMSVYNGNTDIVLNSLDPAECSLCKIIVKRVLIEIKSNKTKENIQHALQIACKHMHNHKTCSALIKKFSNKLVDLIMQYTDPQDICSKLTVCIFDFLFDKENNIQSLAQHISVDENELIMNDNISCILCRNIIIAGRYTITGISDHDNEMKMDLNNKCQVILQNCDMFTK